MIAQFMASEHTSNGEGETETSSYSLISCVSINVCGKGPFYPCNPSIVGRRTSLTG